MKLFRNSFLSSVIFTMLLATAVAHVLLSLQMLEHRRRLTLTDINITQV